MPKKEYYQMSTDEVLENLKTSEEGLSKNEAAKRQKKYGKNYLRVKKNSDMADFSITNQRAAHFNIDYWRDYLLTDLQSQGLHHYLYYCFRECSHRFCA